MSLRDSTSTEAGLDTLDTECLSPLTLKTNSDLPTQVHSKNRFVDRKEGYLISKLSNQLKDDFEGKDTLFSEDIY